MLHGCTPQVQSFALAAYKTSGESPFPPASFTPPANHSPAMDIPPPIPTSEPYFSLNPVHFPVTCASPVAQEWFDRGLTLCYAFNHEEAHRCFLQCLAHDEKCMMGYWGVGYALGANYNKVSRHPIFIPVYSFLQAWELFEPGEVERAVPTIITALKTIDQVGAQGTDLETALVNALRARMPADAADRNYTAWNTAYAEAMKTVYDSHSDDIDIATLYADSLMSLTPWRLWDIKTGDPAPGSRALEARTVLERGMKQAPTHPGILHFYVHLTEMSSTPEKALPAANALVGLVPDGGHLEHMPSHIYVLMGDYARAIACNERGIIADEKYLASRGPGGFYLVYRLHNMQFIVYSAMFAGQYEVAMRHVEMIERHVPEQLLESLGHFIEATYAIRFQVYVRFGRWQEIIATQPPKREQIYPIATAFTHWSKAIAYSATRDVANAEKERLLYLEAYDRIPATSLMFPNTAHDVLKIGTAFLDGELEYRKGNFSVAFTHLEESIRRYDSLVYCEPWSWLTPVRHAYAALKLERGHIEEALEVYYDDLGFNDTLPRAHQHPNNVWALTGAYECLQKLGRTQEAKIIWPLLRAATATADVDVEVSCFCRIDDVAHGRDLVEQGEKRACCS